MENAPLAIVVCSDPGKCDVWVEDCSIAALIIHLVATDLGLGSCWIQIRLRDHDSKISAEEYVKQQLRLKENLTVEAIIAIGYPKEEKPGHPLASLPFDKVRYL
jgi:nitroreductase